MLRLLDSVGADALEDALVEVLEHGTIHIGAVRQVLEASLGGSCVGRLEDILGGRPNRVSSLQATQEQRLRAEDPRYRLYAY